MVEFKINECITCKNHEGNGGYCYIRHLEQQMCDPLKNYIPVDWYKEILVLREKIIASHTEIVTRPIIHGEQQYFGKGEEYFKPKTVTSKKNDES